MKRYIVTGAAGFIGFHVCRHLLQRGDAVAGVDNLNDYYKVQLKRDRLALLEKFSAFNFHEHDICDRNAIDNLLANSAAPVVIHLAAQAGVRYSLENPRAYIDSNIVGFMNILEGCRHHQVEHLVYASSSSVYGANRCLPFRVEHSVDHPVSLYAATKKANELMAHTYSHLYGLPTTGLRFFTVYGPWGRPDMAMYLFCKAIVAGRPIQVFNHGNMRRDFTYIDDIVDGVIRVADHPAEQDPDWSAEAPRASTSFAPYRVYNIGAHQPVALLHLIDTLEACLGKKAIREMAPMQPGDVVETYADVSALTRDVGFASSTPLEEGVAKFVDWFREYEKA